MHNLPGVAFVLAVVACVVYLATGSTLFSTASIILIIIAVVSAYYFDHRHEK